MTILSEKTLIPIGLIGTVVAGAIAWGSMGARVSEVEKRQDRQADANVRRDEITRGLQNDLMAQILILRQDVSEIKGELKNRR